MHIVKLNTKQKKEKSLLLSLSCSNTLKAMCISRKEAISSLKSTQAESVREIRERILVSVDAG